MIEVSRDPDPFAEEAFVASWQQTFLGHSFQSLLLGHSSTGTRKCLQETPNLLLQTSSLA
jgi:hypothetical protein